MITVDLLYELVVCIGTLDTYIYRKMIGDKLLKYEYCKPLETSIMIYSCKSCPLLHANYLHVSSVSRHMFRVIGLSLSIKDRDGRGVPVCQTAPGRVCMHLWAPFLTFPVANAGSC